LSYELREYENAKLRNQEPEEYHAPAEVVRAPIVGKAKKKPPKKYTYTIGDFVVTRSENNLVLGLIVDIKGKNIKILRYRENGVQWSPTEIFQTIQVCEIEICGFRLTQQKLIPSDIKKEMQNIFGESCLYLISSKNLG